VGDLATRGLRLDGLSATVQRAWVVASTSDEVRVAVTSANSEYRRLAADGSVESVVPASEPRTVELVLRRGGDAWRVCDVQQPTTEPTQTISASP
jgi:hypothetical protein